MGRELASFSIYRAEEGKILHQQSSGICLNGKEIRVPLWTVLCKDLWELFTAQINTKATQEVDKNAVMSQLQTMLRCTMYFIRFANLKETFATIPLGLPVGLQNVFNECAFGNNEN